MKAYEAIELALSQQPVDSFIKRAHEQVRLAASEGLMRTTFSCDMKSTTAAVLHRTLSYDGYNVSSTIDEKGIFHFSISWEKAQPSRTYYADRSTDC